MKLSHQKNVYWYKGKREKNKRKRGHFKTILSRSEKETVPYSTPGGFKPWFWGKSSKMMANNVGFTNVSQREVYRWSDCPKK